MYQMNPQRAKHMEQAAATSPTKKESPAKDVDQESGQHIPPSINIESHENGHTVHILHKDGQQDEKHEHAKGDSDGIIAHIKKHIGKSSDNEKIDLDESDSKDGLEAI